MVQTSYQWQEECLKRWIDSGGRGMVQAVTGSGKTRLALCAIDALEHKLGREVLVKIVVPTSALMRQWEKALQAHLAEKGGPVDRNRVSLRGGGRKGPTDRKYMIYVVNSARYELARQILAQLNSGEAVPFLGKMSQKERFEELRRLSVGKDRRVAKQAVNYIHGRRA